jgi:hypothetical protein
MPSWLKEGQFAFLTFYLLFYSEHKHLTLNKIKNNRWLKCKFVRKFSGLLPLSYALGKKKTGSACGPIWA